MSKWSSIPEQFPYILLHEDSAISKWFSIPNKQFYIILPPFVSKSKFVGQRGAMHILFVNHLRPRNFLTSAIQKFNNLVDKQSNLPFNHPVITFNSAHIDPLLWMMSINNSDLTEFLNHFTTDFIKK